MMATVLTCWCLCLLVRGTYWGQNSFFKIGRGENTMQFESDCVFALFDVHHLHAVLDGKYGGSMFGVLKQKDKIFNRTANHSAKHVPTSAAAHNQRRTHYDLVWTVALVIIGVFIGLGCAVLTLVLANAYARRHEYTLLR